MDEETKSLKNLRGLLDAMDKERLSKTDFTKAFEKVLQLVLKIQRQNSDAITQLQQTYALMIDKMQNKHTSSISDIKMAMADMTDKQMKKMMAEHKAKMSAMDDKISSVKNGQNADEVKIVQDVLAQIKLPAQKEVILDDAFEIRNKLETITEENEKLEITAIKGLGEELKKFNEKISNLPKGGGIGGMKKIIYSKTMDLSSQVDGSKKVFTLDERVLKVNYCQSSQFPFIYRKDVDFTATDLKVTFTSAVTAIQNTQTLFVNVDLMFYSK